MAEFIDNKTIARGIERAFIERANKLKLKKKLARNDTKSGGNSENFNPPTEELLNITEDAQEELFSATTIFPLQLFPDTISIDRQKVSIIHRAFFQTANIVSVKITDVLNVESRLGPFFGSVRIYSKYFVDNYHEVNYLPRADITEIHDLLQGYMIATEKEIDCSQIPKEELLLLLRELGHPS